MERIHINNLITKFIEMNRIEDLTEKYELVTDEVIDFIYDKKKEIIKQEMQIRESVSIYFIKNIDLKPETVETVKELNEELYRYAKQLEHYNPINTLILIKRYMRSEIEIEAQLNKYKRVLKKLLDEIDELKVQYAKGHTKRYEQLYKRTERLYDDTELFYYTEMEIEYLPIYDFLRIALANVGTMTKQEFLQLITLEHSKRYWDGSKNDIKETLDLIPDVIGAKEFEELIFVHKVESDDDNPFFEIYFDNFVKVLDENPKLSDKVFDKVQETFGAIQTFTMNDKGELEPTKPKLKLIK